MSGRSGARPSQSAQPSGKFERACALSDLPETGAVGVEVGGVPVAVVRTGGEVFALHDVCSHEEVPLSEGEVYDHTVECWLHGSCFDLRSGKPTGPPATKPVATYRVQIDGDDVLVDVS
jgi:3-phenylpropionate/trans-cinnamate dioxygenase ferredoxin component